MYTITDVSGAPGGEAFLLETEEGCALIDSGFAFCAERMAAKIRERLCGRPLRYVLLTHSHYDHASGSVFVRDEWPDVQIVGSAYAEKIFAKSSAQAVMREMNDNAARLAGAYLYDDRIDRLRLDRTVSEGDVLSLGSMKLETVEAPGHTKCCIAFWCEKEKLLISCETLGVDAGGGLVVPCYLVGYGLAMRSIKKLTALGAEAVLVPHRGLFTGKACRNFIERAVYWNQEAMRRVRDGLRAGKTAEMLAREFKALFYNDVTASLQPEKACDLNLSYMIPMLVREAQDQKE